MDEDADAGEEELKGESVDAAEVMRRRFFREVRSCCGLIPVCTARITKVAFVPR